MVVVATLVVDSSVEVAAGSFQPQAEAGSGLVIVVVVIVVGQWFTTCIRCVSGLLQQFFSGTL